MNLNVSDSVELVEELKKLVHAVTDKDILVCPSFTALEAVSKAVEGTNVMLGSQNICYEDKGAFTGEISAPMLTELRVSHALVGHSERRHVFGESDQLINKRLKKAVAHELVAILCVGEKLDEREAGKTLSVIDAQLAAGLAGVEEKDLGFVIIAYEPVWAIGTGKTATPEQAQEVHAAIRKKISSLYSKKVADDIRILYGGSVKSDNISTLMAEKDIDGALVGGASLKAEEFAQIILSA